MIVRAGQLLTHWSPLPRPSLDLDFLSGPFDPRIQFTRASSAWDFDATGTLVEFPANTPRLAYDPVTLEPRGLHVEEGRTNLVTNPRCEGAVPGTPGTLPTGWTIQTTAGVQSQVVGVGAEDGIPYVDIRFFGTPTATNSSTRINVAGGTRWAATSADAWTATYFITRVGGSAAGIGVVGFEIAEFDSSNVFVGNTNPAQTIRTGRLRENRLSATLANPVATVATVTIGMNNAVTAGVPIDITYRVGCPQFEKSSVRTSPIMPPTGTLAASTRAAERCNVPSAGWLNASAGAIFAEFMIPQMPVLNAFLATLSDNTVNNEIRAYTGVGGGFVLGVSVAGQNSGSLAGGLLTPGVPQRMAYSFNAQSAAFVLSGAVIGRAALTAGLPPISQLDLGGRNAGYFQCDGYIRRIRGYPSELDTAQLQRLTA